MGSSDGTVLGLTQIVDQGPRSKLLNVAVVAEGFQQSELGAFAVAAQQFANGLFTTPPLSSVKRIFNVFRLDVASDQSGADDPAKCADGTTGSGAAVDTYFDASFCGWGSRRLITVDEGLVKAEVGSRLPQWHFILVVVNSPQWGGAGGSIAKFSLAGSGWVNGAIHEMGHTLFGLDDEYEYWIGCGLETDHDDYRNWIIHWEPAAPNVTGETKLRALKWKDLVLPSTPVPTTSNPDCTKCDPQSSPVPVGTVGLFEGAGYYHCGLFRPEFNCKMRVTSQPFCAVCSRRIQQKLAPYWAYVTAQPLSVSVQPSLLPPGKPTAVTVQVKDGYTNVAVAATLEINGQQVGQSNTPFTFTLSGSAVSGTVTAPDYPAATFTLRPAPLPQLRVDVTPAAIPFGRPVSVTVHAEDPQTAATVAGTVRIEGSTVGPTDTPFSQTFNPKLVSEFDPESKKWFNVKADPAGSVVAAGYAQTPIPFTFYEAALSVSVQPAQLVPGMPTQVTVTAVDDFTGAAVAGTVRIGGQVVGQTNTPFSFTLGASQVSGTVQATGYPTRGFSIQSVPPPKLRVWTQPYPVPEGTQVVLTVNAVDDKTNAAVSGAVLVDGQQVGNTNSPFNFKLVRPPAHYEAELQKWLQEALPEGTVSATGFPETAFRWS
jgi:hypothetical protein